MKRLFVTIICAVGILTGAKAQDVKTFKEAYKDYFKVGVAVNQRNVTDSDQMALIEREFNSVTAENDMKPVSVQPKEGEWTWERADRIANFCREKGIKMRGHCLLWHNQFCDWMFYDKKHNLVKKEVLFERMRKHINTVVNRYKDVVYGWDVVNEAITDDPRAAQPLRESTFYKICGNDEFIRKAFEYAHEADPEAILFYNDYNECDPVKRDRIYNLVKSMKDAGVPVNGIGMQGHYNIYGPSEKDFEDALVKYSSLVDHVHITELDIRINTDMGGQLRFNRGEGINVTDDIKLLQETQYDRLFRIMRRHHEKLDAVTFWNLSDRDSWLGEGNYPLPFDVNYKPKNLYKVLNGFDASVDNTVIKEDFVPTATCQPRQEWPKVNSQGYVRFRIEAPHAKYVLCSAGWGGGMKGTVLRKQEDGSWMGTTLIPEDEGFHYYTVHIDGAMVLDPGTNSYYGGSKWMSGVEVPAHDQAFYENRTDIEHGTMQLVNFYSASTNQMRQAYVYTPAGYGSLDKKKRQQRYPVLYLQHGWGENETSWPVQGKTGEILDNLIAEGKCEPMLVVMTYGMTNDINIGGLRNFKIENFQTVLVDELIPYIDSHFLTKANRENRAMAGLSMGSMETHAITLNRPEVFGYWGLFSGATYTVEEVDKVQKPMLIFTSTGGKENPKLINDRTDALKAAGYNAVPYVSPGTAHEFLTWRRSLKEFAPLLFK
ncbi:MAG: endo-1,4-beta-xylanase [Prevotellaceae bacterium]|nr:endo-1,4-beta-xylanase [Prevotellaceae bacterium]